MDFNSFNFSTLLNVTDIRRPMMAPQRISSVSIEGRPGAIFIQKVSGDFVIEVDFYITATTQTEMRNKVLEIVENLDTDVPKPLIFDDELDKFYNAVISDETDFETIYQVGQGTLKFWVGDPYKYALTDDVFTYTTTGAKTFTRAGNTNSFPTIEITGTSDDDGYYRLYTSSNSIKFTGKLLAGEKLVLDSDLLTAYIVKADSSVVSAVPYLDGMDFIVLLKGSNTLNIQTGSGATLTQCKVYCKSRWK